MVGWCSDWWWSWHCVLASVMMTLLLSAAWPLSCYPSHHLCSPGPQLCSPAPCHAPPSVVCAPTTCHSFNPTHSWFVLIHTCLILCALSLHLLLLFLLWLPLHISAPLHCLCSFTLASPHVVVIVHKGLAWIHRAFTSNLECCLLCELSPLGHCVAACLVAILGVGCPNDHFFELSWESWPNLIWLLCLILSTAYLLLIYCLQIKIRLHLCLIWTWCILFCCQLGGCCMLPQGLHNVHLL